MTPSHSSETSPRHIHNAIAAVMGEITGRIEADRRSQVGYDYTSADAIYEKVRPVLAAKGLAVVQHERDFELIETTQHRRNPRTGISEEVPSTLMRVVYEFGFTSEFGETELEQVTVVGQYANVQSTQAMRTLSLKYWLRGKLLLATGEDDVAEHEQRREMIASARPAATFLEEDVKSESPPEAADGSYADTVKAALGKGVG